MQRTFWVFVCVDMRERIVCSAAVAATVGILGAGYVYWRRRRQPTEWRQIGILENIYMSPIKSGFCVEQNEVICEVPGMRGWNKRFRDRSFMVVKASGECITGQFVSGRTHPLITQVKCDVHEDEVVFSFVLNEEVRPLKMNFNELENRKSTKVKFGWDNDKRWVKVIDCGDEASEWIQSCIVTPDLHNNPSSVGTSLRLVYLKDDSLCDDRGLLFDGTSYMLLTQKSLEDLNKRLNAPVTMRNFRPSFVISGGSKPFEEDEWKWVKIGDVVFQYIRPCLRCSFTTVDADTGVKAKSLEPLKTLKSYRLITDPALRKKLGEYPVFGAHFGLRSSAGSVVRKGDPVYVNVN